MTRDCKSFLTFPRGLPPVVCVVDGERPVRLDVLLPHSPDGCVDCAGVRDFEVERDAVGVGFVFCCGSTEFDLPRSEVVGVDIGTDFREECLNS